MIDDDTDLSGRRKDEENRMEYVSLTGFGKQEDLMRLRLEGPNKGPSAGFTKFEFGHSFDHDASPSAAQAASRTFCRPQREPGMSRKCSRSDSARSVLTMS